MGSGKSTVGRLLAKKLSWTFIDTDKLIEEKTGQSISDNFALGEDKFRAIESEVISEVVGKTHHVVALGGGSIVNGANRLKILGAGQLIYLKASPQTLFKRLQRARDVRPLLEKNGDKEAFIIELLKERESAYLAAHITVVTDDKAPETIAMDVLKSVGRVQK
jgi:shikimate kinase